MPLDLEREEGERSRWKKGVLDVYFEGRRAVRKDVEESRGRHDDDHLRDESSLSLLSLLVPTNSFLPNSRISPKLPSLRLLAPLFSLRGYDNEEPRRNHPLRNGSARQR